MKTKYLYLLFLLVTCMLQYQQIAGQTATPPVQWTRKFGGSLTDIPFAIKFTSDGGTIVAGYTESKDGEVGDHPNRDYWDLWIAKIDKCGNLQWQQSYGGTGYESARDVAQTSDGGYIVLAETNSTDGGVIAGYGGTKDIWLLKLDPSGQIQWQKRYGGSGLDIGNNIQVLADGSFLIAGSSSSYDGDITGIHGTDGYTDGVLLRISSQGNLMWSRCYGGSKNDELLDIEIINDKIYVAGYANSTDGDIPANQKNYDVWLLAADLNGNKVWSKIFGGSQNDVAYSMTKGIDGTLTLAGYSTSNDGHVSGAKGSQDFWVINVTASGILKWQKVLGGTEAEYANSVMTDSDGGYIVGGISYSSDGDIHSAKGKGDYWLIKLDREGELVWKQNYGGSENDHLRSVIFKPETKEYYLSGDTDSYDGDFSDGYYAADLGIIKLKHPVMDSVVCIAANPSLPDTLQDVCGYDSVIVVCRPPLPEDRYTFEDIRIPNAFTPNGDGKNDYFGATGKNISNFQMQLFNRYGELVFQSNTIQNKWNGMYKGKHQPSGSFVYFIQYRNLHQVIEQRKGAFILIR